MRLPRLLLITDRLRAQLPLVEAVDAALAAMPKGGAALLLREKDLDGELLLCLAEELRAVTRKYDAPLLLSSRPDVALAAGADGVHLGGDAPPIQDVRRLVGDRLLLGVSLHGDEAAPVDANYAFISPVFETASKPGAMPLGLDGLTQAVERSRSTPLFALGGITTPERISQCLDRGAAGVAVLGAVLTSNDPGAHAAALFKAIGVQDVVAP